MSAHYPIVTVTTNLTISKEHMHITSFLKEMQKLINQSMVRPWTFQSLTFHVQVYYVPISNNKPTKQSNVVDVENTTE